jgi:hypothetical protein
MEPRILQWRDFADAKTGRKVPRCARNNEEKKGTLPGIAGKEEKGARAIVDSTQAL